MSFGHYLLIACALIIVSSVWMTSSKKGSNKQTEAPEQNKHNRPSNDFSALIDAIHYEGAANRGEESREDFGKKVRDYITIAVLALTLFALYKTYVAIGDQVEEMRKVYGPIKREADAAAVEERAWVGPSQVQISQQPSIGQPIRATIAYINTRKSPASALNNIAAAKFTRSDWEGGSACKKIEELRDDCMSTKDKVQIATIIWPTIGFGYNLAYPKDDTSNKVVFDDSLKDGSSVFSLDVCFVYKDVSDGDIHHTVTCTYAAPGKVQAGPLNICACGNKAD